MKTLAFFIAVFVGLTAFAQSNENLDVNYSKHCFPLDEDEIHPDFPVELANKSPKELEKILTDEILRTSSYGVPDLPFECSDVPAAAQIKIQEHSNRYIEAYPDSFVGKCGITQFEMNVIRYYKSRGYFLLNSALRKKSTDPSACFSATSVIETLNGALSKIKAFKGYVRRGADLPENVLARYVVGQVVRERSFLSTSTFAAFGGNTAYIILSKSCANIQPIAGYYSEKEVLCPAGSEFLVLAKTKDEKGRNLILMEQIK